MSVYQYQTFPDFLNGLMRNYPGRKKPINLQKLAAELGYKSPRSVAMIIKGQRAASPEFVYRVQSKLKLTPKEALYIQLLSKKQRKPGVETLESEIQALQKTEKAYTRLQDDVFKYISNWYFGPLLFLLKNIENPDFKKLSAQLRDKVTPEQIEQAHALLKRLGLIGPNTKSTFETSFDIPSAAIQFHHRQMMEQAITSINEQLLADRENSSSTLQMRPEKMAAAKTRLRVFVKEFVSEFHDDTAESVFQFNLQMFKHTKD